MCVFVCVSVSAFIVHVKQHKWWRYVDFPGPYTEYNYRTCSAWRRDFVEWITLHLGHMRKVSHQTV